MKFSTWSDPIALPSTVPQDSSVDWVGAAWDLKALSARNKMAAEGDWDTEMLAAQLLVTAELPVTHEQQDVQESRGLHDGRRDVERMECEPENADE